MAWPALGKAEKGSPSVGQSGCLSRKQSAEKQLKGTRLDTWEVDVGGPKCVLWSRFRLTLSL